MAFSGPFEDRLAIRELYGTYSDSTFRADRQAWLDCWAADCLWSTPFGATAGRAALEAQWDTLWQTFRSMGFFCEIGAIEVAGDAARGRAYCREILDMGDGRVRKYIGAYADELVREAGQWRFSRRIYQVLLAEEPE